ncbi:hypothetical protein N300_14141, partial [Calypte anna]
SPTLSSALHLTADGHIVSGAAEDKSRQKKVWATAGSSAVLPCYLGPRKMWKSWKRL